MGQSVLLTIKMHHRGVDINQHDSDVVTAEVCVFSSVQAEGQRETLNEQLLLSLLYGCQLCSQTCREHSPSE